MDSGPHDDATSGLDHLIDWDLAVSTAARVARSGPPVGAEQAARAVAQLRECAKIATGHVTAVSGLEAPAREDLLVVGRRAWVRSNVHTFRELLSPVVEELLGRREHPVSTGVAAVGRRATGVELGAVLGFLCSRVLGQYDPFAPGGGRLLLIAPNIVKTELELDVPSDDFRLWVCLHEETHRVQFGATPFLAEHLLGEIRGLAGELVGDHEDTTDRLTAALRVLPGVLRGQESGAGLLDVVGAPAVRERVAAVTAVMSLLEGHADVVMDEVGPSVVPSVAVIRERFTRRRAGRGAVDRMLRRLLGMDAKMRQYADGARFVRGVRDQVGWDGFNAVWSSVETLPRAEEIADPEGWVRRVHG